MMSIPEQFDNRLVAIDHYRAYPAMLPYIGANYISPSHRKLLLIGESNYLPEDAVVHKDAKTWYAGTQQNLSETEIAWINNRELLTGEWYRRTGHRMYMEIDKRLSDVVPTSKDVRAISHASYMNAFQRPASETGQSFKYCCTPDDVKNSANVINQVMSVIEPDVVIFVSKYAWEVLKSRLDQRPSTSFDFVCHAGQPYWWRRQGYRHGMQKFLHLLKTQYAIVQ